MHKRAELFLRDWALQHVGQGTRLRTSDSETDQIIARLLTAARAAGLPEAAFRDEAVLRSLIVGVRALANGDHAGVLPLASRRTS